MQRNATLITDFYVTVCHGQDRHSHRELSRTWKVMMLLHKERNLQRAMGKAI